MRARLRRNLLLVATLVAAVLLAPAAALAERRVALVIGNDRYAALPQLVNAVADAAAIARTLEELGFRVFKGENLGYRETNRLHAEFEAALSPGDTAFVFFAGHGIALGAENFCCRPTPSGRKPARTISSAASPTRSTSWCAGCRGAAPPPVFS